MEGRSPQGASPFFFSATVFSTFPVRACTGLACVWLLESAAARAPSAQHVLTEPTEVGLRAQRVWFGVGGWIRFRNGIRTRDDLQHKRAWSRLRFAHRQVSPHTIGADFAPWHLCTTCSAGSYTQPARRPLPRRCDRRPISDRRRSSPWQSDPAGRTGGVSQTRSIADTVPFPPGSQLVLFTDGLVERRDRPFFTGVEMAATHLAALTAPLSPNEPIDSLWTRASATR